MYRKSVDFIFLKNLENQIALTPIFFFGGARRLHLTRPNITTRISYDIHSEERLMIKKYLLCLIIINITET